MKANPRLPLAPLLVRHGDTTLSAGNGCRVHDPVGSFASLVGVSRRQVHRWRHDGVPEPAADRAAAALGLHPAEVWGASWWAVDLEAGRVMERGATDGSTIERDLA